MGSTSPLTSANMKVYLVLLLASYVASQPSLRDESAGSKLGAEDIQDDLESLAKEIAEMKARKCAMCGYQDFIMDTADEGVLRGGTIFYDKVYTETNPAGSSFDASSGKFIAGVAGVYHISASAERGNTGSSADLEVFLRTSSGLSGQSGAQIDETAEL